MGLLHFSFSMNAVFGNRCCSCIRLYSHCVRFGIHTTLRWFSIAVPQLMIYRHPNFSQAMRTIRFYISDDSTDTKREYFLEAVTDEDFDADHFDDVIDPNESYQYKFLSVNVEKHRLNDLLKNAYNMSSKKARESIDEKKLLRNGSLVTKKTEFFEENDTIGKFLWIMIIFYAGNIDSVGFLKSKCSSTPCETRNSSIFHNDTIFYNDVRYLKIVNQFVRRNYKSIIRNLVFPAMSLNFP